MNARTAILALASTVLFCASVLQAQQNEKLYANVIQDSDVAYDSFAAPTSEVSGESSADSSGIPAPQSGTAQGGTAHGAPASDDQWHLSVSPYLWFPGVHGTVGAG